MRRFRMRNRVFRKMTTTFNRHINGSKGAISIFLAILMVPFATIAAALINASRMNSAIAVFDEALCNASNSTLGTYDEFLRSRFGLLAMRQYKPGMDPGEGTQEFISDLFELYMEENMKSLSNTYNVSEISAAGVYPLSHDSVLLSEILEYSKYTIPTQLIIEGLNIEELIKNLTKNLNLVGSFLSTFTAGMNMESSIIEVDEKKDALISALENNTTALNEYNSAFEAFKNNVDDYNSLIDEANRVIGEKRIAVDTAQQSVAAYEVELDYQQSLQPQLVAQLLALRSAVDSNGNPIDNTEAINAFIAEHEEALRDYLTAENDLAEALVALETAVNDLQGAIVSFENRINSKRQAVEDSVEEYKGSIGALMATTLNAGNAVVGLQDAINGLIQAGASYMGSLANTAWDLQIQEQKDKIKEFEANMKAARERGDMEAYWLWQGCIDDENSALADMQNASTLGNAYNNAQSEGRNALQRFISRDIKSQYADLYSGLDALRSRLLEYEIPRDCETRLESATTYYVSYPIPLSTGEVTAMLDNCAEEIGSSSFLALIRALASFIEVLFHMSFLFDPNLCSSINVEYYNANMGGLPSAKSNPANEFAEEDAELSNHYLELLNNGYSNGALFSGAVSGSAEFIQKLIDDITTIIELTNPENWHWYNFLSNLWKLCSSALDLLWQIANIAFNLNGIIEEVGAKALLAGYITYNTANRTTYSEAALTKASYDLPQLLSGELEGYAFMGAETEYIINGSPNEALNQTAMFGIICFLRLLYNIPVVVINQEIASIAGAAGGATFGIGAVIVYVFYLLAEPFVDTMILVNGGDIPIIKTIAFLTPSGVLKMVECFTSIKLGPEDKNAAYRAAVEVAQASDASATFAENYADAASAFGTGYSSGSFMSFVDSMKFNYSEQLFVILMLFVSTDDMINRLADIIQMEGTYKYSKVIDRHNFDLDKSYTYLRASGRFDFEQFLKIEDWSGKKSNERIIYRGY